MVIIVIIEKEFNGTKYRSNFYKGDDFLRSFILGSASDHLQ